MNENISTDLLRRLHSYKAWKVTFRAAYSRYQTNFAKPAHREAFGLGAKGNSFTSVSISDTRMWAFDFPEGAVQYLRGGDSSHTLVRLGHTGWYIDDSQDEMYTGIVYQLSADKDGKSRYVVGYYANHSDLGPRIDLTQIFSDSRAAAYAADDLARIAASYERDYSEDWRLRCELTELVKQRVDLLANIQRLERERVLIDPQRLPTVARAVDLTVASDKHAYEQAGQRLAQLRCEIDVRRFGEIEGDEE